MFYDMNHSGSRNFQAVPCTFTDKCKYCNHIAISSEGLIMFYLLEDMQVHLTVDGSVRLLNPKSGVKIVMSASNFCCGVRHPLGYIYQSGVSTYMKIPDKHTATKYVKITSNNIQFSKYVDARMDGRSSSGFPERPTFLDITDTELDSMFFGLSVYGAHCIPTANTLVREAKYWCARDGSFNVLIRGIQICQTGEGRVMVKMENENYTMSSSPVTGSALVQTPVISSSSFMGEGKHIFVRMGLCTVASDGEIFSAHNDNKPASDEPDPNPDFMKQ